jgi:hypothetical protein
LPARCAPPHRAIFPAEKIAADPRAVWQLPFRCECGEVKVFKYVLGDEQDIKDFEAGPHPRISDHHTTWGMTQYPLLK